MNRRTPNFEQFWSAEKLQPKLPSSELLMEMYNVKPEIRYFKIETPKAETFEGPLWGPRLPKAVKFLKLKFCGWTPRVELLRPKIQAKLQRWVSRSQTFQPNS